MMIISCSSSSSSSSKIYNKYLAWKVVIKQVVLNDNDYNSEFESLWVPHICYHIAYKAMLCVCVCVCLYIYIYIYCHPQTDCFVVSQLFSVARLIKCFKSILEPG